uniref:zinc finger protein 703-like n=1 Tax=Podarcis muralis TaxID=64176 RepID=UPI00109F7B85|nr:zinc finger protein 703-like [Podarcis muralis]
MASGGDQQPSTSANQLAPSAANGNALMAAMPCDPQAFAQFFMAFETFYKKCKPGPLALPAPEPSQDVIPDTLPSNQGQLGTSSAIAAGPQSDTTAGGRPNTRARSALAKKAAQGAGKGKAPAKGSGKAKAHEKGSNSSTTSRAIGTPSVFQDQQATHSSTEDSAGSCLEEEREDPQSPQTTASASNSETQGGKRKAKKKHISAKKKRCKHSETEEESGTSSSDSDSEGPYGP